MLSGLLPGLLLTPLAFSRTAAAAEPAPPRVVVQASRDAAAARDLVAGKIIIGKQAIADSGVQSVTDLLRREPSVSVGKDGRIGLLGLPSYTQILVDGAPPTGADPLTLDLAHVERIEIVKAATAATGPFGIAGTINIVRRKAERRGATRYRFGASNTSGHAGVNGSVARSVASSGMPWTLGLDLSGSTRSTPASSVFAQSDGQGGASAAVTRLQTLVASADASWRLSPDHKLSMNPDIGFVGSTRHGRDQRLLGDASLSVTGRDEQRFHSWSLPLRWNWQLTEDAQWVMGLRTSYSRIGIDNTATEAASGLPSHLRVHQTEQQQANHFLDLEYSTELGGKHDVSAGVKLSRHHEDSIMRDFLDGVPDRLRNVLGPHSAAASTRARVFFQDDWRINQSLSLSLGLSGERHRFELSEGHGSSRPDFTMWSPSLHLVRKLAGPGRRNIRLSLARTFQSVTPASLLLRPSIHPMAPCVTLADCGANGIDTPDSIGNPGLQPERALGANLSYTRAIGAASEVTLELYGRAITDKLGSELSLETVPWSGAPRYVLRTVNLGDARIHGVTVEGRLTAADLWPGAPPLVLQGSLGLAQSSLSAVGGDDSRLDGQLPWRAKLGATYSPAGVPLKLNLNLNMLPPAWQRSSLRVRSHQPHSYTLSADASWKISPELKLIVNADNLGARHATSVDEYTTLTGILSRETTSRKFARIGVRLEMSTGAAR